MTAQQKFIRTKKGVVSLLWNNQVNHSKRRKQREPDYSQKELYEWAMSQEIFHVLFNEWVKSGYKKDLKPSVDRLNDYVHYCFGNIQLITWEQNNAKGNMDVINGLNTKTSKAVLMFSKDGELIDEYHSLHSASRETGVSPSKICVVCKNKRKTAGGFIWKYKEI